MDRYQANHSGGRPYNFTCGMNTVSNCMNKVCSTNPDKEMYSHLQYLPPTMAYIPFQKFEPTFPLNKALYVGTIFPQLCKPFCGKRGGCR